jgi:hypothetical protein
MRFPSLAMPAEVTSARSAVKPVGPQRYRQVQRYLVALAREARSLISLESLVQILRERSMMARMRGGIVYTSGPVEIEPRVPGPGDLRVLRGFARPFSEGAALWLKSLPALCVNVALPVGIAFGLLAGFSFVAVQRAASGSLGTVGAADVVALLLLYVAALGMSGLAVASAGAHLSSIHLRGSPAGARLDALKGFVPWVLTLLLMSVAVVLASFAFLVPGIVVGLRLFWADELALIEREGPLRALGRSWELTRGMTGRLFILQLQIGLLYLVLYLPFALISAMVGPDWTSSASAAVVGIWSGLAWFVLTFLYAFFHAVEIVFFYGVRAGQEAFARDGRVPRDWIARTLRALRAADASDDDRDGQGVALAPMVAVPLALALHVALPYWALSHGGSLAAPELTRAVAVHLALWLAMPVFFALAAVSMATRWLDAWSSGLRVLAGLLVILLPLSALALRSDFEAPSSNVDETARTRVLEELRAQCRSECELNTGDATRCQWTCDCVVRRSRTLPYEQLAELWRNVDSPRAVEYFQRTMGTCR